MDSCMMENPQSKVGYCNAADGNSSQLSGISTCSVSWQADYLYALQNTEARIWNKAKDLIYGYSVIWIILCMPKLYLYISTISLKQITASLSKIGNLKRRFARWRAQSIADPGGNGGTQSVKQYLDSGCPVCLVTAEELTDLTAVHGECGHALCAECFVGMWNHGKALLYPLNCPLCTATMHNVRPVVPWPSGKSPDARIIQLDRTICRYNLVFSGSCTGLLPISGMSVYRVCMDAIGRTLRLGYFFVLFDRKMKKTISFFFFHFIIALVVEYFENAYLLNLLEHL